MKEEESFCACKFFLWILVAALIILVFTGCTTTGKTTTNEDSLRSLICLGFCVETDIKTRTEIRK